MMQTPLSNEPSRRIPTRAGALHSAAGALLVIAAFFALPLYMTAFLGSSSYSATAWVTSNTIASAYTFAIQTSPAGLGTLLGTLIVPLALLWLPLACACVVLVIRFAGIIAPLPRALVRTQRIVTLIGVVPFVVFLVFAFIIVRWVVYLAGIVGYVCMWLGFRRKAAFTGTTSMVHG